MVAGEESRDDINGRQTVIDDFQTRARGFVIAECIQRLIYRYEIRPKSCRMIIGLSFLRRIDECRVLLTLEHARFPGLDNSIVLLIACFRINRWQSKVVSIDT